MNTMNNNDITILWATQSGRAKACARRTIRLLQSKQQQQQQSSNNNNNKLNIHGCCSLDEYNFLSLGQHQSNDDLHQAQPTITKHTLLLFVSTTGDAEQPNNMTQTWNLLLSKSLPNQYYTNISFALFALGDRSYGPQAFCAAGRKLATRLVQLGALPLCQIGYGDDGSLNGGVFADLDVWLEKELFPSVVVASTMSSSSISMDQHGAADDVSVMTNGQQENSSSSTSPYQVKVLQSNDHELSVSNNSHNIEEWQRKEYQQSYSKYFTQRCPATSYQYNDQLERQETNTSSDNPPLLGCVTVNERITSEDWIQDTRHIRIHVTDSMMGSDDNDNISSQQQHHNTTLPYQAGDVATILPSNPSSLVERFISLLPVSIRSVADDTLHITYNPNQTSTTIMNHPWPTTCTLRGLLTYCADIQSLPEREDLYALSSYCNTKQQINGQDQQDKLISLSETSGASLYGDYIIREKRNWVDVLYDFDSISSSVLLGVEELLMVLPSMMPRHFSIASSPLDMKQHQQNRKLGSDSDKAAAGFELELCVAIVEGSTPLGRSYTGCCSKYLASLVPNQTTTKDDVEDGGLDRSSSVVRLWIHPGSFSKLPLDLRMIEEKEQQLDNLPSSRQFETPIMCIGAGTGIAPLRSLILEREARLDKTVSLSHSSSAGDELVNNTTTTNTDDDVDNILVFGCRKKTKDYYYGSEWEALTNNSRLRLIPAFSRDQKHKLYVQRALREADGGELIVRHMLERQGAVYIAGGSKMARAVKDEIVEALTDRLDGGEKDAKRLLNKMKRKGLFSIEAWS